ncbi:hypothetical protein PI124_g7377 [Phytophthora idaei]|nr:hypothetical protein PI125_g6962 [Phytophthora idaei]KAG3160881.1 hypothetical protein PI126_g6704 [Phytophthora idaei]KAG3247955.1 hypothetical protein PI124_g7377 [Phytophthora idaei]
MCGFLNRVSIARDVSAIVQRILDGATFGVGFVGAVFIPSFFFVVVVLVAFFVAGHFVFACLEDGFVTVIDLMLVDFVVAASWVSFAARIFLRGGALASLLDDAVAAPPNSQLSSAELGSVSSDHKLGPAISSPRTVTRPVLGFASGRISPRTGELAHRCMCIFL